MTITGDMIVKRFLHCNQVVANDNNRKISSNRSVTGMFMWESFLIIVWVLLDDIINYVVGKK